MPQRFASGASCRTESHRGNENGPNTKTSNVNTTPPGARGSRAGSCGGSHGVERDVVQGWIERVRRDVAISSRITAIMSTAVWNTTRLAKSELNLTDFSCSAGSFSAITPWLPNRSHAENPLYG